MSIMCRFAKPIVKPAGCLLMLSLASCMQSSTPQESGQSRPTDTKIVKDDGKIAMARNIPYQKLLKSLEAFEAVLRQQPKNRAALEKCQQNLSDAVATLKQTTEVADALGEKTLTYGKTETATSGVAKPAGPVPPSGVPPTLQEIEQQKKATEEKTHLPIGPAGKDLGHPILLESVPQAWVRSKCETVEVYLAEIRKLLSQNELDATTLRQVLTQVRAAVEQINSPPAESGPVTPKGNQP